jgi:hypothetical protein
MENQEIVELTNFEYTPQGFMELKKVLKEGKIVRNPFAKYYGEKVEVTVTQTAELEKQTMSRV